MILTDDELTLALATVITRNDPGYFGDTIAACVRAIRDAEQAALQRAANDPPEVRDRVPAAQPAML